MARSASIHGGESVFVVSEDVRVPDGFGGKQLGDEMARLRAENDRMTGLMSGSRLVIRGGQLFLVRSKVLAHLPSQPAVSTDPRKRRLCRPV